MIFQRLLVAAAGLSLYGAMAETVSLSVDFSTFASSNLTVAKFLSEYNISISTYTINKTADPYGRAFTADNVNIQDGYLTLTVTGGTPAGGNVPSAEIRTNEKNILHGTFKTTAITSPVPGVCHGFFTYESDSQESDIEILTAFYNTGNKYVQPGLQLTNQNNYGNHSQNTHSAVAYPSDPTAGEHEYTLVWNSNATTFYFDDELVATLTSNVPYEPSYFVWNSWSSGNEKWSAGPPTQDAILRISKIDIEYETV